MTQILIQMRGLDKALKDLVSVGGLISDPFRNLTTLQAKAIIVPITVGEGKRFRFRSKAVWPRLTVPTVFWTRQSPAPRRPARTLRGVFGRARSAFPLRDTERLMNAVENPFSKDFFLKIARKPASIVFGIKGTIRYARRHLEGQASRSFPFGETEEAKLRLNIFVNRPGEPSRTRRQKVELRPFYVIFNWAKKRKKSASVPQRSWVGPVRDEFRVQSVAAIEEFISEEIRRRTAR